MAEFNGKLEPETSCRHYRLQMAARTFLAVTQCRWLPPPPSTGMFAFSKRSAGCAPFRVPVPQRSSPTTS